MVRGCSFRPRYLCLVTLDAWLYPVSYPVQFPGVGKADVASEDVENQKAI